MVKVECWGMYEVKMKAIIEGNPYADVSVSATFVNGEVSKTIMGFYSGNDEYIIRFMPEKIGVWSYITKSNVGELHANRGEMECVNPTGENHGPVRVRNRYHFAYADGTRYFPFGTTCYAWIHQSPHLQKQTVETLENSPFNKLRMCIFPKYYSNNTENPDIYPFVQNEDETFKLDEFNPKFFQHLDDIVIKLQNIKIEVDLILLHPYDKGHWGFDRMNKEEDRRYLSYIVARYSAYRNVWWSMANEYDYMEMKTIDDWNEYIECVAKADPYLHLLSIHQGEIFFNNYNPYITHSCVQLGTMKDTVGVGFGVFKMHRDIFGKPAIYDEVGYEGNLMQRWGRNTAQEIVDKYWMAIVSGVYMGHGETYEDDKDIIWWSKGGILKGQSPERIRFLRKIIEASSLEGLDPIDKWWALNGAGRNGKYYLYYFGEHKLKEWKFAIPAFKIEYEIQVGTKFHVDIIDTWNMTITPVDEVFEISGSDRYSYFTEKHPNVKLPEKEYIAIRITRIDEEQ